MPHVIVKLWPGKSEPQKQKLADKITQAIGETLHYGEESPLGRLRRDCGKDWTEKVYKPDILGKKSTLYKQPGYEPS